MQLPVLFGRDSPELLEMLLEAYRNHNDHDEHDDHNVHYSDELRKELDWRTNLFSFSSKNKNLDDDSSAWRTAEQAPSAANKDASIIDDQAMTFDLTDIRRLPDCLMYGPPFNSSQLQASRLKWQIGNCRHSGEDCAFGGTRPANFLQ
ncbi:hypothetical protein NLJ89_g5856 [Agrocybe chaxingu]|uniref:Uncharacterized protein n=1 Tax=Agrocybe chaxingu TaxID=84603 RepID=A0A9W8JXP0_9AGAR|nr:hypothetical protein NLJ89_g5856 [Agrocybe chaxingu]